MATTGVGSVTNGIDNLSVAEDNAVDKHQDAELDEHQKKWGFSLEEVYKIALKFFKEKEGKALQLTYQTKLKLIALTKQAAFGKFRPDVSPDVGFLDVVGNDRRQAWQALGDTSKEAAMAEFVKKMAESCSLFQPYVEAHRAEKEEAERKQKEEDDKRRKEEEEAAKQKEVEELARKVQEAEKQKQHEQEMQIRAALNHQTQAQFRQYAEQQYPDKREMQDELIKQLQDQHFQQYMQQVYQQQLLQQQQQQQQSLSSSAMANGITASSIATNNNVSPIPDGVTPIATGGEDEEEFTLAAASMWTRKDIKEFKDSLVKDKESVIKIGSGETVTVRVPTHEDGTCLFWEFATDYYDIGFGVYFEWSVSQTNTVSVHVSESSDEEDEEEEATKTEETKAGGDVEKGPSKKSENRPPTDEIIPVYRRDCHEEVYCGSHTYPGQGVYLLKFDNSYSLWRSKTLYYRVYYSR
ncbi:hypothetical protein BsWGS_10341 [Bradybaena similaris]